MLDAYLAVGGRWARLFKLARKAQLRSIRPLSGILGLANLQPVEPDEAAVCAATVESLLAELLATTGSAYELTSL